MEPQDSVQTSSLLELSQINPMHNFSHCFVRSKLMSFLNFQVFQNVTVFGLELQYTFLYLSEAA